MKFTPIAASVALTLGLSGCGTDNDKNFPTEPVVPPKTATGEASFNTELTGKAVKGVLQNAMLSVSMINSSGDVVPVAFRSAASAETETYSEKGETVAEAEAAVTQAKLDANPEGLTTGMNGGYTIYLEDDFTGTVVITATTSVSGDESLVRCDAYTGCGAHTGDQEVSEDNDGDSEVDFGEWYKADVELSVVKFVEPSEVEASEASFVPGDANVNTSLTANITFLTSLVSQLLLDADGPVDSAAIADTTLDTVLQVFGPKAAISLAKILGDASVGGGVDLSTVEPGDILDNSNLVIGQLASSIPGLTTSVSDTLAKLQAGIAAGAVKGSDNADVAAVAAALNKATKDTAKIFKAVASGDEDKIKAALLDVFNSNNPDATDAQKNAYVAKSDGIAKNAIKARNKAIESGATSAAELVESADQAEADLEDIGCVGQECEAGDALYTDLAAALTTLLAGSNTDLGDLQTMVEMATDDLSAAQDLADGEDLLAYAAAANDLNSYVKLNKFDSKVLRLTADGQAYVSLGGLLVAEDAGYTQLSDSAVTFNTAALVEAEKVAALNTDLAALLDDVQAKLDADTEAGGDLEVQAAKAAAEAAKASTTQAQIALLELQNTSNDDLATAVNAPVTTPEEADAAIALAETAISSASEFVTASLALADSAVVSLDTATEYQDLATETADVVAAEGLVDDAEDAQEDAELKLASANVNLNAAIEVKASVELKLEEAVALEAVKMGSMSLSDMTVITHTGAEAITDAGQIVADVLEEAIDNDGAENMPSTSQPGWVYSYSEDEVALSLSNDTTGESIMVAGSFEDDMLYATWSGMVKAASPSMATVELITLADTADALEDCMALTAGTIESTEASCLAVQFNQDTGNIDEVDDAEVLEVHSWNNIAIEDGDSGFMGSLNIQGSDTTDMGMAMLSGVSGTLDFTAKVMYSEEGEDESGTIELMINDGSGYKLSVSAMNDELFMGKVTAQLGLNPMFEFGTVTEINNGISITYSDDEVIDYTDVTLIDMTK